MGDRFPSINNKTNILNYDQIILIGNFLFNYILLNINSNLLFSEHCFEDQKQIAFDCQNCQADGIIQLTLI